MISITGHNDNKARSGSFTLLELIVVLLIIAITLAMAAPSLRGFFASRQTNEAARYLLAMTRYARSQAIADGRTYCLQIDIYENTCKIIIPSAGKQEQIKKDITRTYHLPGSLSMQLDDITISVGVADILFSPNGSCTPATIYIKGKQDDTYRIYCKSATELFTMVQERAL